jgi:hypothetical protein
MIFTPLWSGTFGKVVGVFAREESVVKVLD